jgi:hypothetical protein
MPYLPQEDSLGALLPFRPQINSSEMQDQLLDSIGGLTAPSRSACRQRIDPRIEHRCAHPFIIAHVARDDR